MKDKTLSNVISFKAASECEMKVKCFDPSGGTRLAMREVAEQLAKINCELDSSIVEENNEETESMVDKENLYSHVTSTTSRMSQHGTTSSLFYSAGSSI
ncbi:hypothetical protein ACJRO7_016914 [Eucalyptus globulus]|uniref:Uncharacterized protein n=1 Tax=Eucalyptus globulus TaxID=34317 RepID=A0ABD3KUK9_EUCGL